VVAVVTLIRQHLVQTHILRLSSAEREEKIACAYSVVSATAQVVVRDRQPTPYIGVGDEELKQPDKHMLPKGFCGFGWLLRERVQTYP
jgi:hypothetical protein